MAAPRASLHPLSAILKANHRAAPCPSTLRAWPATFDKDFATVGRLLSIQTIVTRYQLASDARLPLRTTQLACTVRVPWGISFRGPLVPRVWFSETVAEAFDILEIVIMTTNIESKSEISPTVTMKETKEDVEQQQKEEQQEQDNRPKLEVLLPIDLTLTVFRD